MVRPPFPNIPISIANQSFSGKLGPCRGCSRSIEMSGSIGVMVKAIIHRVTRNWKSFFLSIFMQDLIVLGRLSKEVPSQLSRHINLSPRCNIRKYREFFGCITLCYFLFHDCRHKYYFLASEYPHSIVIPRSRLWPCLSFPEYGLLLVHG